MARPRHQDKDIEKALQAAEDAGWQVIYPSGHWGRMSCPSGGCRMPIAGTPRNATMHAVHIARKVRKCSCGEDGGD